MAIKRSPLTITEVADGYLLRVGDVEVKALDLPAVRIATTHHFYGHVRIVAECPLCARHL